MKRTWGEACTSKSTESAKGAAGAPQTLPQGRQAGATGPAEGAAGPPRRSTRGRQAGATADAATPTCFSLGGLGSRIHIATSGFSYDHWQGSFYPKGLAKAKEFEYYCQQFSCSELNTTFYRWRKDSIFDSWKARAAAAGHTFQFVARKNVRSAVQCSQFYTHRKRLNVDEVFVESWQRFWASCQRLQPHLGPILFQFPSSFATTASNGAVDNIERLRTLGKVLPASEHFVFEFRHKSWLCPEVYAVMGLHDWCLAITHMTSARGEKGAGGGKTWIGSLTPGPNPPPEEYPLDACSWGAYCRFHGSKGRYVGAHGPAEMQRWADWAKACAVEGKEVWLAFNNTDDGSPPSAIVDARDLAAALRANGTFTS